MKTLAKCAVMALVGCGGLGTDPMDGTWSGAFGPSTVEVTATMVARGDSMQLDLAYGAAYDVTVHLNGVDLTGTMVIDADGLPHPPYWLVLTGWPYHPDRALYWYGVREGDGLAFRHHAGDVPFTTLTLFR